MDNAIGFPCTYLLDSDLSRHPVDSLATVFQKLDKAIHWINHYPADSGIGFSNTYPLDSDVSRG